jgi:hypothetical protein
MAGGILAWAKAARPEHPRVGCKGRANTGPGQKHPVSMRWSRRRAGALLRARLETTVGILPRALLGSTILEISFGNRSNGLRRRFLCPFGKCAWGCRPTLGNLYCMISRIISQGSSPVIEQVRLIVEKSLSSDPLAAVG